jgi:hypothetical protein
VRVFRAFVNIDTTTVALRSETFGTSAITHSTGDRDAFSTLWTFVTVLAVSQDTVSSDQLIRWLALTLRTVTFFTKLEWISIESRRTSAFIASR